MTEGPPHPPAPPPLSSCSRNPDGSSKVTATVDDHPGLETGASVVQSPRSRPGRDLFPPNVHWEGFSSVPGPPRLSLCPWEQTPLSSKDRRGSPPIPHPPLQLILMAFDSYLYNLSYVASQRSFSQGRLHEAVLTALTERAIFNL